jgi:Flp pilus assembly pilin Flp
MKKLTATKSRSIHTLVRGAAAVEYALLIVAVALSVGAVARGVGKSVTKGMQDTSTTIDQR